MATSMKRPNFSRVVPECQKANREVATLCEVLLKNPRITPWLSEHDRQVQRSFNRVDGAPRITCFDYPLIADVLKQALGTFIGNAHAGSDEHAKFHEIFRQLETVIRVRRELRYWYGVRAANAEEHEKNVRYEAFLNVMVEVRRILRGDGA